MDPMAAVALPVRAVRSLCLVPFRILHKDGDGPLHLPAGLEVWQLKKIKLALRMAARISDSPQAARRKAKSWDEALEVAIDALGKLMDDMDWVNESIAYWKGKLAKDEREENVVSRIPPLIVIGSMRRLLQPDSYYTRRVIALERAFNELAGAVGVIDDACSGLHLSSCADELDLLTQSNPVPGLELSTAADKLLVTAGLAAEIIDKKVVEAVDALESQAPRLGGAEQPADDIDEDGIPMPGDGGSTPPEGDQPSAMSPFPSPHPSPRGPSEGHLLARRAARRLHKHGGARALVAPRWTNPPSPALGRAAAFIAVGAGVVLAGTGGRSHIRRAWQGTCDARRVVIDRPLGSLRDSMHQLYQGPKLHITEFVDKTWSEEVIREATAASTRQQEHGQGREEGAGGGGDHAGGDGAGAGAPSSPPSPAPTETVAAAAAAAIASPLSKLDEVTSQLDSMMEELAGIVKMGVTPPMDRHNKSVRSALVQAHKLKLDVENSVLALDQLLRASDLTVALLTAIPLITGGILVAASHRNSLIPSRARRARAQALAPRVCSEVVGVHRALARLQASGGSDTAEGRGELALRLRKLHILAWRHARLAAGSSKDASASASWLAVAEDLAALGGDEDIEAKLAVAGRMAAAAPLTFGLGL